MGVVVGGEARPRDGSCEGAIASLPIPGSSSRLRSFRLSFFRFGRGEQAAPRMPANRFWVVALTRNTRWVGRCPDYPSFAQPLRSKRYGGMLRRPGLTLG